jgi:hypothetical protein
VSASTFGPDFHQHAGQKERIIIYAKKIRKFYKNTKINPSRVLGFWWAALSLPMVGRTISALALISFSHWWKVILDM